MGNEASRGIDALPGLAWTALPEGKVDFPNRCWREYTGLESDDGNGEGWQSAVHPEDLAHLLGRWRSIVASGELGEMEARVRRADGTYRRSLFCCSPLRDASGEIEKWYGTNTDIEDLRQAEAAVRSNALASCKIVDSEAHFRLLIDNIPGFVHTMTPSGELEFVNRQILDFTGKTADQLHSLIDLIHPDDRGCVTALWARSVRTGQPLEHEHRIRGADGVYHWFHNRGVPLRDSQGHIVRWYQLSTDIDERKQMEEQLRRNEEYLLVAQRLTHTGHWALDLSSGTAKNSPETLRLYGVGPGDDPSDPNFFFSRIHPDDLTRVRELFERCESQKTDYTADYRIVLPDGTVRHHHAAGRPVLNDSGALVEFVGTTVDDTEIWEARVDLEKAIIALRASELEVRQSEAFLAKAQRLSRTGSFSWRVVSDELTWSEEVYRIFELDPAVPLTGELVGSRVHPDDLQWWYEMIARQRRDGGDYDHEHRLQMPNLSVKYLRVVAHASRDPDGQLEYIGAIQDVTEHRLSEEALSKARTDLAHVARVTSLGALTASIAHEVKQPLSGILTNAGTCLRVLSADPPNVDVARETARRTIRDANRASEVVTRLRALFSKKTTTTEPLDLNEATREVIALSLSELQRGRVILRLELGDDLPSVTGDRVQLQQVILNLILNAQEAMSGIDDRPRELLIRTTRDEDNRVCLTVRDTGVGFAPQEEDKLFEAFYTTKGGGMGIGLSVSRSIIESHQGRLWATPNDGKGATFSFSIPCGPQNVTAGVTGAPSLGAIRTSAVTNAEERHVRSL